MQIETNRRGEKEVFRARVNRRPVGAYTLTEVMVAVMVLGVIGGGYYTALSSGFSVLQTTREDLRATQIMMQKLEAVRLCTWTQLTNFTFQETYDPLTGNNRGVGYYGTVSFSAANALNNNPAYKTNMYQVTVSVNWTNITAGRPLAHNRQMQTQVSRYGLQNYVWGAP